MVIIYVKVTHNTMRTLVKDQKKCLKQIKSQILLYMCASFSELPFNIAILLCHARIRSSVYRASSGVKMCHFFSKCSSFIIYYLCMIMSNCSSGSPMMEVSSLPSKETKVDTDFVCYLYNSRCPLSACYCLYEY